MSEALSFLQLLFRGKPEHLYLLVWARRDKSSHWFQSAEKAAEWVERHSQQDIYTSAGLSPQNYGERLRCKAHEVAGIQALGADIDMAGEAHKAKNYPTTEADALSILPSEFPPTVIVHSGHGLQPWWIFDEPFVFAGSDDRVRAAHTAELWNRYLKFRAAERNWVIDSTFDLSRVMRVPGTLNTKEAHAHVPVTSHTHDGRLFSFEGFEEFLAQYPSLQRDPERAAQALEPPPPPTQEEKDELICGPDRIFDPALLDLYLTHDERFAKTWTRKRDDFTDQSPSGYDLAVANFGVPIGLSLQQILDLMISRRRIHGEMTSIRLDKLLMTIRKAQAFFHQYGYDTSPLVIPGEGVEATVTPVATVEHHANGAGNGIVPSPLAGLMEPLTAPVAPSPEPALDRIALCAQFAAATDVPVIRIEQQRGQHPIWRFHMQDGSALVIKSAATLRSFGYFSNSLLGQLGIVMKKIKPEQWTKIFVPLVVAATIFVNDAPENNECEMIKLALNTYLPERGCAKSLKDLAGGKSKSDPFAFCGHVAVSAIDLRNWLTREWGFKPDIHELTGVLAAIGAEQRKFTSPDGSTSQSRWLLPEELYQPEHFFNTNLLNQPTEGPEWRTQ